MLRIFIVNLLVISFVLWIAGRVVVGGNRAKFSDAALISFLGTILGTVCLTIIPFLGFLFALVLWLALIRHFYETGWLGAFAVALLAVIVMIALTMLLGMILLIPSLPFMFRF